jgi:hypothetical protein
MLTTAQKAEILRNTGAAVSAMPAASEPLRQWIATVEALFVSYVAARAAKSLRDSEEARQLVVLRRISATPERDRQDPPRQPLWA